jgi:hypothetical protein
LVSCWSLNCLKQCRESGSKRLGPDPNSFTNIQIFTFGVKIQYYFNPCNLIFCITNQLWNTYFSEKHSREKAPKQFVIWGSESGAGSGRFGQLRIIFSRFDSSYVSRPWQPEIYQYSLNLAVLSLLFNWVNFFEHLYPHFTHLVCPCCSVPTVAIEYKSTLFHCMGLVG